jgi:acyl carrier protein
MIFEKVREILVDQLGVSEEEVKLETNLMDDLGADSLDFFQVVMELEDEFKIKIDNGENLKTVEDAVKYIENAIEK